MTCLESLSVLIPNLTAADVESKILPVILTCCGDRIPNVQFCAARIIERHLKETPPANFASALFVNDKITKKLTDMMMDSDLDVALSGTKANELIAAYV